MIRNEYTVASNDDLLPLRLLYVAFIVFVLLRIGLNSLILNQYFNYTTIEGSTIEKIHPAFYGIAMIALALLLSRRIELGAYDLGVLRGVIAFMAGIAALLTMLAVGGRSTSAGYLLDAYIVACIAAFIMMSFPAAWRASVGEAILIFLIISALVGIAEFGLRRRLLPYPSGEETFRPTGLSDHPLALGMWCAVGICFVSTARWRPVVKLAAVAILFVGALASGARVASIAACISSVAFLIVDPLPGKSRLDVAQRKIMLAIAGLLAGVAIVVIMYAVGALDRFEGVFIDQSALARVSIYGVFDFLTWNEFLFGADITRVQRLALEVFGLPFIESSFVIFTVQFGLVGALLFAVVLGNWFWTMLRGQLLITMLATAIFFGLALSNNALSVKSADILMITLLILSGASKVTRPALA